MRPPRLLSSEPPGPKGEPAPARSASTPSGCCGGCTACLVAPRASAARLAEAALSCVHSLYFWACFVYLVYTCQALAIDYCDVAFPPIAGYNVTSTDDVVGADGVDDYVYSYTYLYYTAPQCQENGYTTINRQYVALGVVHVVNAVMYAAAWAPWLAAHATSTSQALRLAIMVPECLNVAEASIYLYTATTYASIESSAECAFAHYRCPDYIRLHHVELGAAVVELVASLFWVWSWWTTHERGPGRGLSIADPDMWATLLLVVSSFVYITYYTQVIRDPMSYGTNFLYQKGDVMYFVGAVLYLWASMRDNGAFFYLSCVAGCLPEASEAGRLLTAAASVEVAGTEEGAADGAYALRPPQRAAHHSHREHSHVSAISGAPAPLPKRNQGAGEGKAAFVPV